MKKICVVIAFFCMSAHAATMCMPDLSTCESCTDGTYSGYTWSANCCGVSVSGIALPFFYTYGHTVSLDSDYADDNVTSSNMVPLCVMLKPITTMKGYAADCIPSGYTSAKAAEYCSRRFVPKCVFSECDFGLACGSSGSPW